PEAWVRAEIPIENVSRATRQMLRLGADVEVLQPPALRQAVALEARRTSALYGRGRPRRTKP
ncbi:MAG: WYL domain-containing protein, partial [Vitreimonas sp.]